MISRYCTFFLPYLLFFLIATTSSAQMCGCPSTSECKPCSGGYTSITLRYNGNGNAVILAKDGVKILADLSIAPQQEFTISGSKKNEKFAEKLVPILVNGSPDTMLGAMCSDVNVGGTYGAFTVIAAVSINGTTVCCTSPVPDIVPPQIVNIPKTINVKLSNA